MKNKSFIALIYALLAAVFYAINTPFSKGLLTYVPPTYMAAFLYLGAGAGIGILYAFQYKKEDKKDRLTRNDLPYTLGMIILDILAPICLMVGVSLGSASNASLLGNFEIVATSLLALILFKEKITSRLWLAIVFITLSSILLSFEGLGSLDFSYGSLFVLLATCFWGLENNCTRQISDKSTYQIVVLKGVFSGGGSLLIALAIGEQFPEIQYILPAMVLGFVAYGLSIFLYIKAQSQLGAAKTSAYYAVAPFIGAFISFVFNGERPNLTYYLALSLMVIGTAFVVYDTLVRNHSHAHAHLITHTHNGTTHQHRVYHSHDHNHFTNLKNHHHHHKDLALDHK